MGEAAESMLEGECCQECGEFFHDDSPGYPRSCAGCGGSAQGGGRSEGKRRREKRRRLRRAAERKERLKATSGEGWKKHTPFHWSRTFKALKLDYWPSTGRFQIDGIIYEGDPVQFMKDNP